MHIRRTLLLISVAALLPACAATQMTPAEQEMVQTMGAEAFQPATRELRDGIETQDLLAQASFWSREHRLNPADLEASIKLASAVRRMGNPQQAIEITQATRALYPKDPYLLAEHAAALVAAERGAEALPIIERGLGEASGYARLWSLRGASLDQMERFAEARSSYGKALSITPYDPNILGNMGLSYALEGDYATATEWLEKAVAVPGVSDGVRRNLDLVRELSGQPGQATAATAAKPVATAQQGPSQPMPGRRMQVLSPQSGMTASDAARHMAGGHAKSPATMPRPTQATPAPLKASDPNALARLAQNANTRPTSSVPTSGAHMRTAPQQGSPFAPQLRPQSPQQHPQARPTLPPQGYPQAYPQGAVHYPQTGPQPSQPYPQGYTQAAPQAYAPGQILPRGPARSRR